MSVDSDELIWRVFEPHGVFEVGAWVKAEDTTFVYIGRIIKFEKCLGRYRARMAWTPGAANRFGRPSDVSAAVLLNNLQPLSDQEAVLYLLSETPNGG